MSQPKITLTQSPEYREGYSNTVQVRSSFCDFLLKFCTVEQQSEESVTFQAFQGIYLSPQQAKSLAMQLQQSVAAYEKTFGEINLGPQVLPQGAAMMN
jgi:exo-beta-1,3-glucanase (GH17 family)